MIARLFSTLLLITLAQITAANTSLEARLTALGAKPCPDAPLLCLTLQLPLDHTAPTGKTIDIRFGVHLATGGGQDVLFYATGGPGSSGLALSDGYLADLDPKLTEGLNIVFWEQRGTGGKHIIQCPKAQGVFDLADLPLNDPPQVISTVQTYVSDCQAELIDPGVLPYLSTDQAIRDLETFRRTADIPQVWLYGESYGTQFAQQYAAAFGAALKGLVIAGVVRLDMTFEAYYANYTAAAEHILDDVFKGCTEIPGCHADMRGGADAAYAKLAAQLGAVPQLLAFPLPNGQTEPRVLTERMLALNAYYSLYTPRTRATFLRALAQANEGDMLPMLRLAYDGLFIDSATLHSVADQTQLPAAYFAILCSDFVEGGPNPDTNVRTILATAQSFKAIAAPRLDIVYYADRVVCAEWPVRGKVTSRPPFAGGSYPTFILTATTDPITTASMAYAVADQVQNGYLVTQENGPHVIFGAGLACPDLAVANLLLQGQVLPVKTALCSRELIADYTPLPLDPSAFLLSRSVVDEVLSYPEFRSFVGGTRQIGCNRGGSMTLTRTGDTVDVALVDCGLWRQKAFSGTMAYRPGDTAILNISAAAPVQYNLEYRRDLVSGAQSVLGVMNGQAVETPRPLP